MEGFGWYTHEVFQRIVNQHPEHEFIFLFDRPFDKDFIYGKNVKAIQIGPQARHPWLFYWWFEHSIPRILKKHKVDLFISPDGYLSLKTDKLSIAVMHDLNFEHYPQDLKPHIIRYYKKYFPRFAKKADHILTVSQYSKNDIAKTYSISPDKITVGYNAADQQFTRSSNEKIRSFRERHKTGEHFFLSVGSIHQRKNITRLLQAYDLFRSKSTSNYRLVLVGNVYNWNEAMKSAYEKMNFKNDVVFAGHLTKEELIDAYSAASALVFPSYFEGFGIPLVEAMRCDCPVICSNATCFPEVAGDAALYFDPFNIEDIADKLLKFTNDDSLKNRLIEKGRQQQQLYNWDRTAQIVWNVIESTARAKGVLS